MDGLYYLLIFIAAVTGGFVNAVAGGGTLITFPFLIFLGIPPLTANITNTIALCPGYISGVFAQRKDLPAQKNRLLKILPVAIAGGIAGGLLLLVTKEELFRRLVPFLILAATLILAMQKFIRNRIIKKNVKEMSSGINYLWLLILIFMAALYGGFFGAGLGVILMAVLGLLTNDSLKKLNVLKQAISFAINVAAALYFSFSGKANWVIVIIMACGAIIGGATGGKFAGKVREELLRWIIISVGLIVSIIYFVT